MSVSTAGKALLAAPRDPTPAATETIVAVAREFKVGPLRQLREMAALRFGPGKLASHEYYSTGAFHPDYAMEDKRRFVGKTGSYLLNVAASPMKLTETRAFLRDKVMYTALLQQLGLPTTETQAVAHPDRRFGDLRALRSSEAVATFLRDEARYPLFAKPCEGAGSVGSAMILAAGDDVLHLANGQAVAISDFAREVIADYPEGVIFQTAIRQHPALQAMTGDAVGTMRVVTTRDGDGIKPLYTVWKVPSPRAMSDNFWQAGSMVALIDDAGGRVLRCKSGTGLDARLVDRHPASGHAFPGFEIPHWQEIQHIACEGHGLFPEFGIVGWDIAVGTDGPIIIECNDNPYHVLWQLAAGQGIRTEAFDARFAAAAARSEDILKGRIATYRARVHAQATGNVD